MLRWLRLPWLPSWKLWPKLLSLLQLLKASKRAQQQAQPTCPMAIPPSAALLRRTAQHLLQRLPPQLQAQVYLGLSQQQCMDRLSTARLRSAAQDSDPHSAWTFPAWPQRAAQFSSPQPQLLPQQDQELGSAGLPVLRASSVAAMRLVSRLRASALDLTPLLVAAAARLLRRRRTSSTTARLVSCPASPLACILAVSACVHLACFVVRCSLQEQTRDGCACGV